MADLASGDLVLTQAQSGEAVVTRVVVNQHVLSRKTSEMITMHMSDGRTLSLTPDHALFVNGALARLEF